MAGLVKNPRDLLVCTLEEVDTCEQEFLKKMQERLSQTTNYYEGLLQQIPQSLNTGPLMSKTPKVLRKRAPRIATIPEDDIMEADQSAVESVTDEVIPEQEIRIGRMKRKASKIADDNMKKQLSLNLHTKLRRPSELDSSSASNPKIRCTKRSKASTSSSVDDSPLIKLIKIEKKSSSRSRTRNTSEQNNISRNLSMELEEEIRSMKKKKQQQPVSPTVEEERPMPSKRKREEQAELLRVSYEKTLRNEEPPSKKANTNNETITSEMTEVSLYEDAIGKTNIMSSTMNASILSAHKKLIMNSTVILERLPQQKMNNETFVVQGSSTRSNSLRNADEKRSTRDVSDSTKKSKSGENRPKRITDSLITDDESSPERKEIKKKFKKPEARPPISSKRVTRSNISSAEEDEIAGTPTKRVLQDLNSEKRIKEVKSGYKNNALFSPYSKESVKKRVEAFEQVGLMGSSQPVETTGMRLTRTKTRALAAANDEGNQSVVQKLARKSLAKAKKISVAKEKKEKEETKENYNSDSVKTYNVITNEKTFIKQSQRMTPIGKSKLQMPTPISRIPKTPSFTQPPNGQTKPLTSSRINNIVTTTDSFITKSASKTEAYEKMMQEKRKKVDSEDAIRKREQALKAKTEEKKKKRELKELKNKQAREAKEKLDMEKRLKAEKEREEKAKLAMQMLEKQREEVEKKKLAHLQRLQEKEERRKQEEQLRQQRMLEQEEAERQLAEQKRLEQEAERRRLAEARAQQQAAEAARLKALMHVKAKQAQAQHKQAPTSYKLDSEPDDDESDDESKPKHDIPSWAQASIRQEQLRMQIYVPNNAIQKLFNSRKCTPDLTELFHGISKNRLKRTSSAIWKTPPRFSMMED